MPVLSIVIPTFNSEATLRDCLNSIFTQTFQNLEVLVMDGSSTDATASIVHQYQYKYSSIQFFQERDAGIYDAMNKGVRCAKGAWIYFMGSDDILNDKYVLEAIFNNNNAVVDNNDYLYGNVLWGKTGLLYRGKSDIFELFKANICHQAIFVRKLVFERLGLFNLRYALAADWEFNIRCFSLPVIRKGYLNLLVAKYSLDGLSKIGYDQNFLTDKRSIFYKNITGLPWTYQVKFKALYWRESGYLNKLQSIYYNFLYRTIGATRFFVTGEPEWPYTASNT